MLRVALAALAGALLVQAGMYGQPVIHLDAKTFKTAMSTEHAAMVAFVAPWCGHCKALAPEYTSAASSLSPLIPFYSVDCDEQANKRLCAEYQIQGFPTIKAFPRAGKGAARDYNGERKKGALVDFAKGLVPDRVRKMRVDDGAEAALKKFLDEKKDLPHALLVHPSAPSIPFLWKVLGHRLSNKMHLGFIRDSPSHSVLTSLGQYDPADTSRDATRCIAWQAGSSTPVEHEGGMKFNALLEFLQSQIEGKAPPKAPVDIDGKQKPEKADGGGVGEDAAAKRRAKLEEAEKRDQARRAKQALAQAQTRGERAEEEKASPVEDAPEAVPAEGVEEGARQGSGGSPEAGEEPAEPQEDMGSSSGAEKAREEVQETGRVHVEL